MRRALPALGVLAVVLLALFRGVLLRDETLLDTRDLYRCHPWSEVREEVGAEAAFAIDADPVFQFIPIRYWEAGELRAGRWPLWCDDVLGGFPPHADPNVAPLDPTRALLLVLRPIRAWEVGIALRLALAFLLMRLFLRGRGLGEAPAVLGSLLFVFGALPAFWLRHDHYLWVHAFVPLVAHLAERHGETGRLRFAAYAGLAAAAAALGGALQYAAILLALGGLWILVRRGLRGLPAAAVYLLVGLGTSAAAWWPVLGWVAESGRDTAADAVFWFPPWHLPTLVAPSLFEDPIGHPWRYFLPRSAETVFGLSPAARTPYAESTVSVGAVGMLLLAIAWRRCRGTWARAYRNAGLLLLLGTMLGPLLPFVAPGLAMTALGRFNLITTFALAVLAAKGLDDLNRMTASELARLRSVGLRALLVIAILAVGAGLVAAAVWAAREPILLRWGSWLASELPPVRETVDHFTGPAVLFPLFGIVAGSLLIFGRVRRRMPARLQLAVVVFVAAIEVVVPALRVNRSWPLAWAYPEAAERLMPPEGRRALPVGFGVYPANTPLAHGRRSAVGYLSAWPKAYAHALYGDRGGSRRDARIERLGDVPRGPLMVDGVYDREGWREEQPEIAPGVLASSFHEGWRAYVDGEEREVIRHEGWAMRALPPPAPGQTVEWIFTAPRLRQGAIVALATLLLTAVGLLVGALRKRRR